MAMESIVYLIVVLFLWVISGFLSNDLHYKKGYNGGFWVGFLLGIVGLIYSAGLPDKSQKKIVKKGKEQIIQAETDEDDNTDNDYVLCEECGFPVFSNEKKCSYCGAEKKQKQT